MNNNHFSRRQFIKGTIGTSLLVAGSGLLPASGIFRMSKPRSVYDAKDLPTTILGKTGVRIPRVAIGLGSRFCTIESGEASFNMLNYALDHGLYYWDTAWAYENLKLGFTSEGRLGEVVKTRRDEIFLSSKVTSRDPNEAMRQIESSLKRLQTDHLDMLKIHDIKSDQDVAKVSEKGNLIELLHKMKEQGICRFIGFSGHTEAGAMKIMADRGDFDSMLIAMNHYNIATNPQKRQELAITAAKAKGMGVMVMKVIRPKETIKGFDPKDLVRYALSLKGPDGIVLGMDSMDVVKSNLEILRNFKPMEDAKMKEMADQLQPFYNHKNLPWMKPGYCDGNWA